MKGEKENETKKGRQQRSVTVNDFSTHVHRDDDDGNVKGMKGNEKNVSS